MGHAPTRRRTSRACWRGPRRARGSASPDRSTRLTPADPRGRRWSATTSATAPSRSGRCTRRATTGCWSGWRTSPSRTPGARSTGCTWPGPRYLRSEDRSFFRPLVDLEPGDARVFLGHRAADRRRRRAAAPPRHRVAVPERLRRRDVLRLRPPARRGRDARRCASTVASCARYTSSSKTERLRFPGIRGWCTNPARVDLLWPAHRGWTSAVEPGRETSPLFPVSSGSLLFRSRPRG